MLFSLGLLMVCALLTPFAIAYVLLLPGERSLSSLLRFYLGSILWPFLVFALFELVELQNIWLDPKLGFLALLAPLGGVLLDRVWRQSLRRDGGPERFIPALSTSLLMLSGAFFHALYLASTDYNPAYYEQSLRGTWRGRDDDLVLANGDWHGTVIGEWSSKRKDTELFVPSVNFA